MGHWVDLSRVWRGLVMGVREMVQHLEQWQMGAKDLHRRMILAPTPRERERWHAVWLLAKAGRHRPRRRHWDGTPTP